MPVQYEVFWTRLAEKDLTDIWDYIASDNRAAAIRFIGAMERQITTLERFPERCPLIPENVLLGSAYRHLILGDYRTIFRISGRKVFILRCIHGSRLMESVDESS